MNASFVNWITSQLLICVTLTTLSLTAVAEATTPDVQKHYTFDLPQQSVADSLNDLAKHTGAQFLFPFQLAQSKTAKPITGHFTLLEATAQLLQNTGLKSDLVDGVLTISPADDAGTSGNQNHKGKRMNITTKKSLLATMIGLFAATGGMQQAYGQDGEAATAQGRIDEIIVTATQRETSLQDTSMSMSVLTGADLEKRGIVSIDDVFNAVPGVDLLDSSPGYTKIQIRGVGTTSFSGSSADSVANATTATYFDDFVIGNSFIVTPSIRLVDMSRVEVLKGPQGTLYGQSAMGGVVRYISNKPEMEKVHGGGAFDVSGTAGGGTNFGAQGYINIPLTDNLALRAVGYHYDNEGFIDSVGQDSVPTENSNSNKTKGARIALRWQPTDQFILDATYLFQDIDTDNITQITSTWEPTPYSVTNNVDPLTGLANPIPPVGFAGPDIDGLTNQYIDPNSNRHESINLKLSTDFNLFNLSVMAGRQKAEGVGSFEAGFYTDQYDNTLPLLPSREGQVDTVEARFLSHTDQDRFFDWLVGFWYESTDVDASQIAFYDSFDGSTLNLFEGGFGVPFFAGIPIADGDITGDFNRFYESSEIAVYGELAMHLTDKTTLTLGYRRSDIENDTGFDIADGTFDGGRAATIGLPTKAQQDVNTYKVKFEYALSDDILLFSQATSGYRIGGISNPAAVTPGTVIPPSLYESDDLWNYEVGAKTAWLEGRLIANLSAYYINWSDIQLEVLDESFARFVDNVGKAEIRGLELESTFAVTDVLTVGLNVNYSEAELAETYDPDGSGPSAPVALAGDPLPGSADLTYSAFADWRQSISPEWDLTGGVFYRYVDERTSTLSAAATVLGAFTSPAYDRLDLRVGLAHAGGVNITLFADNLLNEIGELSRFRGGSLVQVISVTNPRTVGLRLSKQFE